MSEVADNSKKERITQNVAAGSDLKVAPAKGTGRLEINVAAGTVTDIRKLTLKGGRQRISIGENAKIRGLSISMGDGHQQIEIGRGTTCRGLILNAIGANIFIGEDCMFSGQVALRTHDMHDIVDQTTGEVVNPPRDITLGKHVWIGNTVIIMPGVTIGDNCIIGAGSIVTKDVPAGCLVAGTPARIMRENVTWRR